jgi:hypothetical protein
MPVGDTIGVANGGTGATTASAARANLGAAAAADQSATAATVAAHGTALSDLDKRTTTPEPPGLGSGTQVYFGPIVYRQKATLSGATTLAFAIAPEVVGSYGIKVGDRCVLELTGNHALTFPSSVVARTGSPYDGTRRNFLTFDIVQVSGGLKVTVHNVVLDAEPLTGLVFRHVTDAWITRNQAEWFDPDNVAPASANRFSRLGALEEYRRAVDGRFKFRIAWPNLAGGADAIEWFQASNPLDHSEEVVGLAGATAFGNATLNDFRGLALSADPRVLLTTGAYGTAFIGVIGAAATGMVSAMPAYGATTTNRVELSVIA